MGAGPLDSLLSEPGITDILVNGANEVYVDRGSGLERVVLRTGDEAAVRRLATRLAAAAGRRLDDATPYVDVRLPDGTRFHAVLVADRRTGDLSVFAGAFAQRLRPGRPGCRWVCSSCWGFGSA